jgi:hypothetical protein
MITATGTNILLDVPVPNEKCYEASVRALENAATSGSLVVCDLMYAELCTYFSSQRECDAFLGGMRFRVGRMHKRGTAVALPGSWATAQSGYTEPRRAMTTMTIAIEVKPEVQAELAAQAAARGMDVPAYAAAVLEEAAHVPGGESHRLSPEQLERTLDEMAQFSHHIPSLPDEALSRASLYQDHD